MKSTISKKFRHLFIVAIVALLAACSGNNDGGEQILSSAYSTKNNPLNPVSKPAKEINVGKVENGVFTSKLLGITMPVPKNWYSLNKTEQIQGMQRGAKILAGKNKKFYELMWIAHNRTHHIFSYYRYPLKSRVKFNPSIVAVAEDRSLATNVKTSRGYMLHVQQLLKRGQMRYKVTDQFRTEKIGSVKFDMLQANLRYGNNNVTQEYYVAYINKYAVSIIVTYASAEGKRVLHELLKSISIEVPKP